MGRFHTNQEVAQTLLGPPGARKVSGAARGQLDTHLSPRANPLATSLLPDSSHIGCGMSANYVITLRLVTLEAAGGAAKVRCPSTN